MPSPMEVPPEDFTIVYTKRKLFRGKVIIGFKRRNSYGNTNIRARMWYIKRPGTEYEPITRECAVQFIQRYEAGEL